MAAAVINRTGWWAVLSPDGHSGLVNYNGIPDKAGWKKAVYLGSTDRQVRTNWHLVGRVDPRLWERPAKDALSDAAHRGGAALYTNPAKGVTWDAVPTILFGGAVASVAAPIVGLGAAGAAAAGAGGAGAAEATAAGGTGAAAGAAGGAATGGAATLATAGVAASMVSFLADPHLWLRLVEIVGGVALLLMGLKALTGGAVDPVGTARKVARV